MPTRPPSRTRLRPTRAGLMLGLTLLVLLGLLMVSAQERAGLGQALSVWLAGSTAAAALLGWHNLCGLRLQLRPPRPVHAGQAVELSVDIASERSRHAVGVSLLDTPRQRAPLTTWTDVPAQGSTSVQLHWPAPGRGRHRLPTLQLHSLYPLGICRAWSEWAQDAQVLVYPAPEPHAPPLPSVQHARAGLSGVAEPGELEGVRAYRSGDAPSRVLWKKTAQAWSAGRDDRFSRDAHAAQPLWLDHADCVSLPPEDRLSRLTAWVLQADRQGLIYGLRLPGSTVAPGRGAAHRARCLEALALC